MIVLILSTAVFGAVEIEKCVKRNRKATIEKSVYGGRKEY
jgi:hypothetical protein